ncbi:HNH endonuclease [Nocardioides sp. Bht2]|uniref:HNH endonuclease n=1 Tax=Nocardioides sp. Bht2 TaxID=3392297 RepID=UPI0039B44217
MTIGWTTVPIPQRAKKSSTARQRKTRPPRTPKVYACVCPNCGETFEATRSKTYCTNRCRLEAEVVRYTRKKLTEHPDGWPEDIDAVVRTKMAHAVTGTYNKNARRLSPKRRAEVIARDGGRCVRCNGEGTEIDHIAGDSTDLENLQLLCNACHRHKTNSCITEATDPESRATSKRLWLRVYAREPLRVCDASDWAQNRVTWLAQHRAQVF